MGTTVLPGVCGVEVTRPQGHSVLVTLCVVRVVGEVLTTTFTLESRLSLGPGLSPHLMGSGVSILSRPEPDPET